MEFIFTDVNEALPVMWQQMMAADGHYVFKRDSRNGPVHEARYPVMTIFKNPRRRVLFDAARDANPFFHLFEAIWMLAGRNEVNWLAQFNKQMLAYSDDGVIIAGSDYGRRWREPLAHCMLELRKNPDSRRAFIPIFEPRDNLRMSNTKDLPCNTGVSFLVRDGALDMTVFNRSNDMLLGAYGANYVHFGFLQEYVACALGITVGTFTQVSSCFHLYTEFPVAKRIKRSDKGLSHENYYETVPDFRPGVPVLNGLAEDWQVDANFFIDYYALHKATRSRAAGMWHEPFFEDVAAPMFDAWYAMVREKNHEKADASLANVKSIDWQVAASQWCNRRSEERKAKASERVTSDSVD